MIHQELAKYIVACEEVSIPELQKECNLSYSVVRRYIEDLIQRGKVSPLDELKYFYIKNEDDPLFIYALWLAIQASKFSMSFFQSKFNIDDNKIEAIIDWMKENGYVKTRPFETVKLTKESFLNLYAPLDVDCKDPDAFLEWGKENENKIKQYLKPKAPKKPFSDKEYYDALELLCKENPQGSKEDFISIIENKFNEFKEDEKMHAIYIKMIGEIAMLNEFQFQSLREGVLS